MYIYRGVTMYRYGSVSMCVLEHKMIGAYIFFSYFIMPEKCRSRQWDHYDYASMWPLNRKLQFCLHTFTSCRLEKDTTTWSSGETSHMMRQRGSQRRISQQTPSGDMTTQQLRQNKRSIRVVVHPCSVNLRLDVFRSMTSRCQHLTMYAGGNIL